MLTNVRLLNEKLDPFMRVVLGVVNTPRTPLAGVDPIRVANGVYLLNHFSFDLVVASELHHAPMSRAELEDYGEFDHIIESRPIKDPGITVDQMLACYRKPYQKVYKLLHSYGVCDDLVNLLDVYDFTKDPRKLVISLTEIRREDQPERDGWRWHKWGPYCGRNEPSHEYLYDEVDIKSIYVYHVYRVVD